MKLIFIYGLPASGKLTVAERLSTLTSIPLFHNHLSRDLVKDIYGDNLMAHYELVDKIRFEVFEYCAKNNTDLIFTYVYASEEDDKDIREFIRKIEDNGGQVSFIELTAKKEDLLNRVGNESRKKFKKLTNKKTMAKLIEDMSKYTIPFVESLSINTSNKTPDESVKIISEKLDLF